MQILNTMNVWEVYIRRCWDNTSCDDAHNDLYLQTKAVRSGKIIENNRPWALGPAASFYYSAVLCCGGAGCPRPPRAPQLVVLLVVLLSAVGGSSRPL